MSSYPPPPPPHEPGLGTSFDEAIERIEMELRHAIGYVNDAVIPQVRRESISAMRIVADTLRSLADRMDARRPDASSQQSRQGQNDSNQPGGPQG